ncbi:MAG: hypothetical protein ACLVJ6_06470 [Merdibacter sp.]
MREPAEGRWSGQPWKTSVRTTQLMDYRELVKSVELSAGSESALPALAVTRNGQKTAGQLS